MTVIPSTMMAWKKTKPEFGGFELVESAVPTRTHPLFVELIFTFGNGMIGQLKMCQLGPHPGMKPAAK